MVTPMSDNKKRLVGEMGKWRGRMLCWNYKRSLSLFAQPNGVCLNPIKKSVLYRHTRAINECDQAWEPNICTFTKSPIHILEYYQTR